MPKDVTPTTEVSAGKLKSYIQRIERQEEERAAVNEDLKSIYDEAKGEGFNTTIIRKIIIMRRKDAEVRREEAELLDLYLSSIGDTE
jgi:uncharacterized protein (UPF0335 family)